SSCGRLPADSTSKRADANSRSDGLEDNEPSKSAESVIRGPESKLANGGDVVPSARRRGGVRDRAREVAMCEPITERHEPECIRADHTQHGNKSRNGSAQPDRGSEGGKRRVFRSASHLARTRDYPAAGLDDLRTSRRSAPRGRLLDEKASGGRSSPQAPPAGPRKPGGSGGKGHSRS